MVPRTKSKTDLNTTSTSTALDDQERTDANFATLPNAAISRGVALPDLGLLNPLLQDPEITEIMVNDLRNIAIEKRG